MTGKYKLRFLAVFSFILLCIGVTIKSFQNDTFYIIKVGEYIWNYGIDLKDHWCWITKLPYTYPHWLYDVIIYLVYFHFGNIGIYISTIFFFIILILTIYILHLKFHKNEFLAFFISLLSVACLCGFATARAQLLTIILFLLEVYCIEKLISCGKKKYICYLTLISLLVANLHATIWLFYFILYLPFLGEHLFSWLIHWKPFQKIYPISVDGKILIHKVSHMKELIISFILGFIMGIFTPSRICYTYIFRIMIGDSQSYIMEHAPLVIIQHPCLMIFILVGLLVLIFSQTKIQLRELFMICGLIFMSLVSGRHVIFFYSIGLLYLSILICRYLEDKNDKTLQILGNILVHNKIIYVFFLLIIICFSFVKFQKNFRIDYIPLDEYPVDAVHYIKQNLDVTEIRLYNDYNFGSYLLFQDIPVFIDSRCDLYLSEFNGLDYSIFDDEMEMEYHYEKKFRFYGVTHALVQKNHILYTILLKDQDYNIIYKDKYFVLFEKGGES